MRRINLLRNPSAVVGMLLLAIMVFAAVFAPQLSNGDPMKIVPAQRFEAPSALFPLGTDDNGRSLYTVLLHGARTALMTASIVCVLAIAVGFVIGVLCGYYRRVDAVLMRVMDGMMSFPNIILVLSLVGVLGRGLGPVIFGVTLVYIPPVARVVRAAALSVKEMPMVESARAIGASNIWILARYVAPETVSVLIVQATTVFAQAILSVAALAFLGVGLPPDLPNWGSSLSVAQKYISIAWWLGVFPGLAIVITVLGLILLGDALRDALDPRAQKLAALARERVTPRRQRRALRVTEDAR